jgi:hypothetical protein
MPYYGAIQNPVYEPAVRDISAITNAFPVSITTTFAHSYLSGLIVRIRIPFDFGMQGLGDQIGSVTVTGPTTFTMPIDTTHFDPFVIPAEAPNQPLFTPAQVVPIGEDANILTQSFVNILTPQF